jgi:hypothetical protein
VAQSKSKRRSRKRHRGGNRPPSTATSKPRPAPVRDRPSPERRPAWAAHSSRANPLKAYGAPPPNRFGGVPVSEIAIFAGAIGFVVGLLGQQLPVLFVGLGVCALGVLEFTTREHFSGYRSHSSMLAAFPAVLVEGALVLLIRPRHPLLVLPAVVPVYALAFWLLRRRFLAARQLRLARPPVP